MVTIVQGGKGAFITAHHELHQALIAQPLVFLAEEPHRS
jgi:hypothetical protein